MQLRTTAPFLSLLGKVQPLARHVLCFGVRRELCALCAFFGLDTIFFRSCSHATSPAVRQREAPRKTEPTSPDPPDTLIEELDEDEADVSEIIGENDKDQEDT
jgi:hypothetical protein